MAKKEVQKSGGTNLASVASDLFAGYEDQSGFNVGIEDYKVPFLKVLQGLSPECNSKGKVEGAAPGLYINTATKQLYKKINIIILSFQKEVVCWRPDRGGMVCRYPGVDFDKLEKKQDERTGKWHDPEGNELVQTISYNCINADNPCDIFIMPLSGTSFKHARTLNTRLRFLQINGKPAPVCWAGVWEISTEEESNDKGNWHTIGNTPTFKRYITPKERDEIILPAIENFKSMTQNIDYSHLDDNTESEEKY